MYQTSTPDQQHSPTGNGRIFAPAGKSVGALLDTAAAVSSVKRIYTTGIVGGGAGIAGLREWATDTGPRWQPVGDQYVTVTNPRLTYQDRITGRRVSVMRAASWVGEDTPPDLASAAFDLLTEALDAVWNPRNRQAGAPVTLAGSPAGTGRLLLGRTWRQSGRTYDPVDPDLAHLIRSTSGQGRFETCPGADTETSEVRVYDARLMYGALANELQTGPPTYQTGGDYVPYRPGRYHIKWSAPKRWSHLGLLPEHNGTRWAYPTTGTGWVDGAELHLAVAYGWKCQIVESITWRERSTRPLDTFARRLIDVRNMLSEPAGTPTPYDEVREAAADACRSILIQTIGLLHGSERLKTVAVPANRPDLIATTTVDPVTLQGDSWTWTETAPPSWPEFHHPEWTTRIWAKARARLLEGPAGVGALTVPVTDIYALALDSIATTTRVTEWEHADNGGVGRFRLKKTLVTPSVAQVETAMAG